VLLNPAGPLAWASGRAGSAQPMWAELGPAKKNMKKNKKNRKNRKICVCMNKNNINLLVYSPTPESGIKH